MSSCGMIIMKQRSLDFTHDTLYLSGKNQNKDLKSILMYTFSRFVGGRCTVMRKKLVKRVFIKITELKIQSLEFLSVCIC